MKIVNLSKKSTLIIHKIESKICVTLVYLLVSYIGWYENIELLYRRSYARTMYGVHDL